jgi:hypothetical protein
MTGIDQEKMLDIFRTLHSGKTSFNLLAISSLLKAVSCLLFFRKDEVLKKAPSEGILP